MKTFDVYLKDKDGNEVKKVEDVPLTNGAVQVRKMVEEGDAVEVIFRLTNNEQS